MRDERATLKTDAPPIPAAAPKLPPALTFTVIDADIAGATRGDSDNCPAQRSVCRTYGLDPSFVSVDGLEVVIDEDRFLEAYIYEVPDELRDALEIYDDGGDFPARTYAVKLSPLCRPE